MPPLAARRAPLRRLLGDTLGQDLIEYALIGAFISLAVYAAAGGLGVSLNRWYDAFSGDVKQKSNCSDQGIASSGGACNGTGSNGKGKSKSGR
jgi:Flp pilus assembly pilin Flp